MHCSSNRHAGDRLAKFRVLVVDNAGNAIQVPRFSGSYTDQLFCRRLQHHMDPYSQAFASLIKGSWKMTWNISRRSRSPCVHRRRRTVSFYDLGRPSTHLLQVLRRGCYVLNLTRSVEFFALTEDELPPVGWERRGNHRPVIRIQAVSESA
jgi:hypothetical protein